MIGYTGPNNYYLPQWTVKQVEEVSKLLFEKFDGAKFEKYVEMLQIASTDSKGKKGKDEEGSHFGLLRSQSQMEIIRDEEIIIQRGEYSRFFCSSKSQSNCSVFHEKLI